MTRYETRKRTRMIIHFKGFITLKIASKSPKQLQNKNRLHMYNRFKRNSIIVNLKTEGVEIFMRWLTWNNLFPLRKQLKGFDENHNHVIQEAKNIRLRWDFQKYKEACQRNAHHKCSRKQTLQKLMETLASAKISRQDVIGSKKSQQKSFKRLVLPV